MLKDRRALVEQEVDKQKKACGAVYYLIITGKADAVTTKMYDSMKAKLADMMTDLVIINQMIADGHK